MLWFDLLRLNDRVFSLSEFVLFAGARTMHIIRMLDRQAVLNLFLLDSFAPNFAVLFVSFVRLFFTNVEMFTRPPYKPIFIVFIIVRVW